MTIRCSVFIATSLDGYIAREDGSIDWLDAADPPIPPGEDMGYNAFIETVDTLVMGSHSYETVLAIGEWHYGELPVIVLTSRDLPIARPTVSLSRESPRELVGRLSAEGRKHLYIDGGKTIRSFLAEGLIDDLTITTIPVLLGSGIPLFGPLARDVALEHLGSRAYEFGFVQDSYRVRA